MLNLASIQGLALLLSLACAVSCTQSVSIPATCQEHSSYSPHLELHHDDALLWEAFVSKHHSEWLLDAARSSSVDAAAVEMRRAIFNSNLKFMRIHNADTSKSYRLGITPFADLTSEEFVAMYCRHHAHVSSAAPQCPPHHHLSFKTQPSTGKSQAK